MPKIVSHSSNPMIRKMLANPPKKPKPEEPKPKKQKRPRIWAVDFDGTLHKGKYPNIGQPCDDLIAALILAKLSGVRLILWTSRDGDSLTEALYWCEQHGLTFDAVNDNLEETKQAFGFNSRKIAADLYIDDRAFPYWGSGKRGEPCKLQAEM